MPLNTLHVATLQANLGPAMVLFSSAAGAMRIPQKPDQKRPIDDMIHYLTDYYAMREFKLTPVPFSNYDQDAFYKFYGIKTQIKGRYICGSHR